MSNSSLNQRTDGQLGKFDINDLKCIKVAIRRSHIKVNEQTTPVPILRSIEEPERLIKVIHYRTDEGLRPIFERDDIIVNKSEDVADKWVCKCGAQKLVRVTPDENKNIREDHVKDHRDYHANKSRNIRSRSRSYDKYKTSRRPTISPSHHQKSNRHSRSPQPSTSTSNRYDDGKNLGKSRTSPPPIQQSKDYRNKYNRSVEDYRELPKKSPTRYKNRSRSPIPRSSSSSSRRDDDRLHKYRYHSRSPPPVRHRRSPHLRESTRWSRSRSPPSVYHRSRRSRSREHRYSRHERRSRSPSRYSSRYYSPHRHRSRSRSREYKIPTEIQYYPGEEYWMAGQMPPRFIPGGFIQPPPPPLPPPAVYPRGPGLMPRAPIALPPFHQPYRQRYPVYNNRTIQPLKPKPKPTTTTTTTTNSSTTTPTANTVTTSTATSSQDSAVPVASSSSEKNDKEPVLSSGNNDSGTKE